MGRLNIAPEQEQITPIDKSLHYLNDFCQIFPKYISKC